MQKLVVNNKSLSNSRLPRPLLGIKSWGQAIDLKLIKQTVEEGDVVNTETIKKFQGVVIPMESEVILSKPPEQQSWEWYYIFTEANVVLVNNDRIVYNDIAYKIMERRDYSAYGHCEYHAIKDWQYNDGQDN
jgi:hypothetical protein